MEVTWNHLVLDLSNLIKISRGEKARMEKYLRQFLDLIPVRMNILIRSLEQQERKTIRQTVHQMSPQLQFFGIPGIQLLINRLECEYETMPFKELETLVTSLLTRLSAAIEEVDQVLEKYFE